MGGTAQIVASASYYKQKNWQDGEGTYKQICYSVAPNGWIKDMQQTRQQKNSKYSIKIYHQLHNKLEVLYDLFQEQRDTSERMQKARNDDPDNEERAEENLSNYVKPLKGGVLSNVPR